MRSDSDLHEPRTNAEQSETADDFRVIHESDEWADLEALGDKRPMLPKFDHASALPRKACLADISRARVYFVAGAGLIKIGITTNITSRFRAIRNSSPVPVELLGSRPGTAFAEGALHSMFAHLRRHGEWFEDAPELRAEIKRQLKDQP